MGYSIAYDDHWKRDIGYGVIAYCDHPKCNETIDRGLSYVCGGEPYGEPDGCGLYFCEKHRSYVNRNENLLCPRCAASKSPYKHPKPEHPDWVYFKLRDGSWKQWRDENPDEVARLQELDLDYQAKGVKIDPYVISDCSENADCG